ncbi:MAG: GTPase Era [Kiritimatiellae bacterium]|nr:GTPase Era [Kiritimatiellia bacterium]
MTDEPTSLDNAANAPATPTTRAGVVALIGRANVGKSSLLNAILGEKVSIVSPVAQTTRNIVRGILTDPRGQLVFHDTPGIHKAVGPLGRVMNRLARSAAEGADVALLVLDAHAPPREEDLGWMKKLHKETLPIVAALNKMDLGGRYAGELRASWAAAKPFDAVERPSPIWVEVSAVTGQGLDELVATLFRSVPEGPLLFPEDILTDYPRKLAIADIIREKLFAELRDELPHAVAVWVEELDDSSDPWRVRALIYVRKNSQKGIVIGEKGRLLRKVRRAAETELQAIYDHPVSLDLWVKVEPKWDQNYWLLKQFGYVK